LQGQPEFYLIQKFSSGIKFLEAWGYDTCFISILDLPILAQSKLHLRSLKFQQTPWFLFGEVVLIEFVFKSSNTPVLYRSKHLFLSRLGMKIVFSGILNLSL